MTDILPIVFTNEFGIIISDNDCQIKFVVSGEGEKTPQAHVAMSLKSAKTLYKALEYVIQDFEKTSGTEVPFDAEKFTKSMSDNKVEQVIEPSA